MERIAPSISGTPEGQNGLRHLKIAVLVGGFIRQDRRDAVQLGTAPRIDVLEMEQQFGAKLYDFTWLEATPPTSRLAKRLSAVLQRLLGWSGLLAVRAAWETRGYDRVYAAGEDTGLPYAVAMRLLSRKRPRIIMRMEQPTYGRSKLRRAVYDAYLRLMILPVDVTLCRTRAHVRYLKERFGVPLERLKFVPEPSDSHYFSQAVPVSSGSAVVIPGEPYILSAGLEMRDYLTLIRAVRDLPVKLIIAAGSPWSKFSFDSSDSPELPPNVQVSSFNAQQMRELYRSARFIVVPVKPTMRACGMNVVLEAWAMERAVIASRTVGLTDYIEHGETGLLVEPGSPDALRAAISTLLNSPAEAQRIGKNGRGRMEQEHALEHYLGRVATAMGLSK